MNAGSSNTVVAPAAARESVITRTFAAPRSLVWRAWTEPARVMRWWGPRVYSAPVCKIDLRVGGAYLFCMRSPEGQDFWSTGVYREIVPIERLVYTDSFADEHGNPVPASHYGMGDDWPLELVVTMRLEDLDGKTKMTLTTVGIPPGQMAEMSEAGMNESLDKLAASLASSEQAKNYSLTLPSDREIVFSRTFDAPRDLVFAAFTRPEHLKRWWGPRDTTLSVCEVDLRPGGAYRFVVRKPDGSEYPFSGVYREVDPPARFVSTFSFDLMPGHDSLVTMTFEEQGGKTTMKETILHQSADDRDGHLHSGMEAGAAESMDRLAELLATLG